MTENSSRVRVNFFIAGAAKCGTTSLARWLSLHPNVFIPEIKEPDFFYPGGQTKSDDEYRQLYSEANKNHIAIGDASVRYIYSEEALRKAEDYTCGAARYLVMLRNPVDMAESFHAQRLYTLNEDIESFERAWRAQEKRSQPNYRWPSSWYTPEMNLYGSVCLLGEQLERLFTIVEPARVKVVFLEDIKNDPRSVWLSILKFLHLPDDGRTEFQAFNTRRRHKIRFLALALQWLGRKKRLLGFHRSLGFASFISGINRERVNQTTAMSTEFRKELLLYFKEDIKKIEALTGKNLSHWQNF